MVDRTGVHDAVKGLGDVCGEETRGPGKIRRPCCSARAATAARMRNVTIIEVRSAGQYRIDTVSASGR
ncbi:hypothetical protein, partial [Streptomyces sp. NPDC005969]|uniref:hypothetical protein n=1 Tax=Streptomyces sp. NPDC005969 TaxID=3156722 RepID=UPI0033C3B5A9